MLAPFDRLVWIDVETFGLDPIDCPIIELGFIITDLEMKTIDTFQRTVWSHRHKQQFGILKNAVNNGDEQAEYVFDMHTKNGLWDDALDTGELPATVMDEALAWLREYGIGRDDPLCGSSVQFDRGMLTAQMNPLAELFSYRNIDVSSVKEICRRYNPEIYEKCKPSLAPVGAHRVLPDLDDTIAEFKYYRDEFLIWRD